MNKNHVVACLFGMLFLFVPMNFMIKFQEVQHKHDSMKRNMGDLVTSKAEDLGTDLTTTRAEKQSTTRKRIKPKISICALTKSRPRWKSFRDSETWRFFVRSVYVTTQSDVSTYDVNIFLGCDTNDLFWLENKEQLIRDAMLQYNLTIIFNAYEKKTEHLPFNQLMQTAFVSGADYLVRVNDDTEFVTKAWIPASVEKLQSYHPPNVGVVGPKCNQGNLKILTHDMVHKTHLQIFDTYYPSVFHNWYIDDWISQVYGTQRTTKMTSWVVHHHIELGSRYSEKRSDKIRLEAEIERGMKQIQKYLLQDSSQDKQILSFSLYGNNPRYTQGAIANADLYKKIFSGWTMRVYHDDTVAADTLQKLRSNGVELISKQGVKDNKMSWRFLVVNDHDVAMFCCRDIDSRLSMREELAVKEWIQSGKDFHVMRDHPSHSKYAMSGGMWCMRKQSFEKIHKLIPLISSSDEYLEDMKWLNNHVWKIASKNVLQHDSFSCDRFGGGMGFPSKRRQWEHVGSVYIDGKMREKDVEILRHTVPPQQCLRDHLHNPEPTMHRIPLCVAVVAHQGKKTLDSTLLSYQKSGFLDMTDDFHIFFQEIDTPERRAWAQNVLLRYPQFIPIFERSNLGHEAIVRLVDSCAPESLFFLPLEEDFVIKTDYGHVSDQLTNAISLLQQNVTAVKLRHRTLPGDPNYSYQSWKSGTLGKTHLLSHVMWDENAEKHVAGIWTCGQNPKTWCAKSANAHYTNNPVMYRKDFARALFHKVPKNSLSTQKFEQWLTTYWSQQNFQVAHSDGIFTHQRLDRELGKEAVIPKKRHKKNVVMAAAVGYGLQDFENFILPLRRVSDADIVLFVPDDISNQLKQICHENDVIMTPLPTGSRLGVKGNRYIGYAETCQRYDMCFATDFRDVFFQADPFENEQDQYDLILSKEFASVSIKKCPYNREWIQSCWGDSFLSKVGHEVPICSGTIMGNSKGFEALKNAMLTEMQKTSNDPNCKARDQGHLNYLYYAKLIPVKILAQPRGEGIVNTVGYIYPRKSISDYLNKDHRVINDDGSLSPVVHQYDRFPELVSTLQKLILKAKATRKKRLELTHFITNKKFLSLCDAAFRTRSKNDLKLPIKKDAIICVQGTRDVLDVFFQLEIRNPFTLISIESDESVPQNMKWLENRYLKHWYSWNSIDNRVTPIPIGLNHDSQLIPMMQAQAEQVKVDKVFVNFKQDTQERIDLFQRVKNLDFVQVETYKKKWQNANDLKNHYETISKYKWVLCPRGAGQDTHRLWEALYLGAIPVVVKSTLFPLYEDLPIIQLNDWSELSLKKLETLQKSLPGKTEQLTFSYWAEQIKGKNTDKDYRNDALFTSFFSHKMCHPGRTGENCTEKLDPANPWYVEDCPNLLLSDSLDLNASLKNLGGHKGCHPAGNSMGLPLSYCAYLCYSHPLTGVTVIPFSIWKTAQVAESRAWKGNSGNSDRSDEHKEGFQGYHILNGLYLGDVIEVGAGPWTQTRAILDSFEIENTVRSFTIHEPSAHFYKQNTPSCAYKSGRLEKMNKNGFYSFPVTVFGEKGESLTDRQTQYDTLVAINVIEHVQNAYEYLKGLHKTLKPGGLLIFHERFFDDPVSGDKVLGRNLYHPIRITKFVLDVFLDQFDVLMKNENPTTGMIQRKAFEHGYYVIARKKKPNTIKMF